MTVGWYDDRGRLLPPPPPPPPGRTPPLVAGPRRSRRKLVAWLLVAVVIAVVLIGNLLAHRAKVTSDSKFCRAQVTLANNARVSDPNAALSTYDQCMKDAG